MSFSTVIAVIELSLSLVLLVVALICFYLWRPSVFETTAGYLRNVRHIPKNTPADISASNGSRYMCGRRHKPMIFFEYTYNVNGVPCFLSYFLEDNEPNSALQAKLKIHYDPKKPSRAYREGEIRMGLSMGIAFIILSALFLIPSVAVLLEELASL